MYDTAAIFSSVPGADTGWRGLPGTLGIARSIKQAEQLQPRQQSAAAGVSGAQPSRAAAPEMISVSSVVMAACRVLRQQTARQAAVPCARGQLPWSSGVTHLLYDSVSFSSISDAFFVELSMADMRDACSLQLFSVMAL